MEKLIAQIETYAPGSDFDLVRQAYDFAVKAHAGQLRKSGAPYVTHPLSVARVIAEMRLGVPSICAGLLHDAVEDTNVTVADLTQLFGHEIAFLVDGVTKIGQLPYTTNQEKQAENFRKMLLAMAKDIRVILVKFCDRLDNMRTLSHLPVEKQERIAQETMDIFAPLAHRLGVHWVKSELEDLSFRYLFTGEWEQLTTELNATAKEREKYITETEEKIGQVMTEGNVSCRVTGRAKNLWSLRQKMKRTKRGLSDIHDAIGFRVITQSKRECYDALGVAHATWTPIPGRFKDYVALPKPNMYRSLHTSVIGPGGQRIEIQIRTEEMHTIAEQGIAAHWKYKEGKPDAATKDDRAFAWLRRLMESQRDVEDPSEFIESVKIDLFGDEVYVFTPQGDVIELPKDACPIDLAYSIHSNIGDHCSGARVNGMMVPLRYQLRNGDTVEIITSPNQKPNKDWLTLVKTSGARTKIRHRLRKEQRDKAQVLGKELIEKELRTYGYSIAKLQKRGELQAILERLKCRNLDDLILQVGYGRIVASQVSADVIPAEESNTNIPEVSFPEKLHKVRSHGQGDGILVQGERNVLVRFARCCMPLPGDPVVGYVTRGRGVTIHRLDCTKALDLDPERRTNVEWDSNSKTEYQVGIKVVCQNRPGILANISQAFSDSKVNISQAHCVTTDDGTAVNTFHVNVRDLRQLKAVIRELGKIKGVSGVERVISPGNTG